jgi:hypothetical protein
VDIVASDWVFPVAKVHIVSVGVVIVVGIVVLVGSCSTNVIVGVGSVVIEATPIVPDVV